MIDIIRNIVANGLEMFHSWVDVFYDIYYDTWEYIGGVMSMRHQVIHDKCAKQKLNTKISMETEVVGTINYIPWMI